LISALERPGYGGRIAVSTLHAKNIETLGSKGADTVFLPFQDAAGRAVERLRETP